MRAPTFVFVAIAIIFLCSFAFAEPKFPPLTGRIVDTANMLDANARQQLDAQLAAFEQASGIQLVVATLPDLQGYEIEEFGYQLGRAWGIGQRDKNNGVLLIVAQAERKVRIEVGYGLEGTLTDALSANIINTVITPQFKTGQFADGIEQGAQAIMQALQGEYQPRAASAPQRGHVGGMLFWLLLFGVAVIFLRGFGGGGGYGGRGVFFPGGLGGGGFGGGGGGFSGGGGGFGGGGASGSW
ncbi:MAG TPA: TPM domain-containing protein [Spongiibacteraceae bacterium]